MKLKEIILDFTSLLDVIMIILFWFIIHYKAQAELQITQAEQSASEAISQAQQQMEEAEWLAYQASEELEALAEADARQGSIMTAIRDFRHSSNIIIKLIMEEDGWRLDVYRGNDNLIGTIPDENEKTIGAELQAMFSEAGYASDDTILCVFTYNSAEPGTRSAYQAAVREFRYVQIANSSFSYSEVDLAN